MEHHEERFIVRTWRARTDEAGADEWRGLVEHVATGERSYFRDFADLSAFIVVRQQRAPGSRP